MSIDTIQSRVRQLAANKEKSMTAEQFFTSREFLDHANAIAETACGKHKVKVRTTFIYGPVPSVDGSMCETAYTNGRDIVQDTASPLALCYESLLNQYLANIGIVLHECAHILYMDFDANEVMMKSIEQGFLFGEEPEAKTAEEADWLDSMKDALANPVYRPIFQTVYHELLNRIADPHDEDKLMDDFGSLATQAIVMVRAALQSHLSTFEQVADNSTKLEAFYDALLQFVRFGEVFCDDFAAAQRQFEPLQKLTELAQALENARYTDDPNERAKELNKVMLAIWPFIKEALDEETKKQQQSNGQNQSSQGSGDPSGSGNPQQGSDPATEQAVQNILNQLNQGAAKSGGTVAPQNGKTSATAKAARKDAQAGQQAPMQTPEQKQQKIEAANQRNSAQDTFSNIAAQIAKAAAEAQAQGEVMDAGCSEILTCNQNSTHKAYPIRPQLRDKYNAADEKRYSELMEELEAYSKRLQKQMLDMLRDMQEGSIAHHRSFGNRFEANSAYRPDQKYYAKAKLPQDWPDMAISILVDHSGSMSGTRLEASMKAAMLLYDFATHINIPVCVAGHNTSGSKVNYFLYTDFNKVSENEKYRLATMCADGCNRDGAAVEISANRLSKRPESAKLLIVISDGQPNHSGYGGEEAAKDISSIVRKYRKQGVETIAAAIGDDKDRIKAIYGEGSFLDITDLATFPKLLVGLVKKRITP